MMQAKTIKVAAAHPADRAVPTAAAVHLGAHLPEAIPVDGAGPMARTAAPKGSLLALPIVSGVCCLGLILFLIAATIVLALIPLYTSVKNITPAPAAQQFSYEVTPLDGVNVDTGDLNTAQKAALQNNLQQQLNKNPNTAKGIIKVVTAKAISGTGRRKRQTRATSIIGLASISSTVSGPVRAAVINFLKKFILEAPLAQELQTLKSPTTTAEPVTTTTGNGSRVLVRRSLEEGGAPSGMVYVDSHEMASIKGNVSSVSFYVDQTCASATVEFGAFELINRNLDTNTAELLLSQRSGELKVAPAKDLKRYMSLITIRLCSGNAVDNMNSGGCQGHQFPVLPHQYLGIRSDTCRLGFAPVPVNRVLGTTWKLSDKSDPFAAPYQKLNYIPADYTILQSVVIDSAESDRSGVVIKQTKGTANAPRVLFIGSFAPRRCGLAKFLEDLTDSYPGPHNVVAMDENSATSSQRKYSEKVIYRLNETDRQAYFTVADIANSEAYDVVNIQHEYALYGGMLGEYVVALMAAIRKPVIVTMHTVIPEPTTIYISATRALCATATRVIVLSNLGRRLLVDVYGIDETKISVVPHGVPDVEYSHSLADAKTKLGYEAQVPTMATFGLLHRNKNIQLGLKAMATVVKSVPNVMYLIIGQTHPMVQNYEGESYRRELEGNVTALGLTKNVEFIDKYVSDSELLDYLGATDIYLTPYAREDQYVSGTLAWAVGLGKAVVSTPYLYAKELLANGRGFLVPFEDHELLGSTLTEIMQNDDLRDGARRQAYKFGHQMAWPMVCRKLQDIFRELLL